jgi:pimeloyl-ACP methyl ester carboxylesterase
MQYIETDFHGFKQIEFEFDYKKAILVFPKTPRKDKKWCFKTEYFGAFPSFQIEMLEKGYYVANIQNETRWCLESDTERQANFAEFLHTEFGLCEKFMTIGMSCGGMQSVYLAAKHPEHVAAIYIDAPVINYLSCPCGVGDADDAAYKEFVNATGLTIKDLINYRKHPQDYIPKLIENKIPMFLIAGDSDNIVPFDENGIHLVDAYNKAGLEYSFVIKKGCNHHPHGIDDNTPLFEFVEKYYG